jgi:hypothetical protein
VSDRQARNDRTHIVRCPTESKSAVLKLVTFVEEGHRFREPKVHNFDEAVFAWERRRDGGRGG